MESIANSLMNFVLYACPMLIISNETEEKLNLHARNFMHVHTIDSDIRKIKTNCECAENEKKKYPLKLDSTATTNVYRFLFLDEKVIKIRNMSMHKKKKHKVLYSLYN